MIINYDNKFFQKNKKWELMIDFLSIQLKYISFFLKLFKDAIIL